MSNGLVCRYSHTVGLFSDLGRGFFNPVDVGLGRDGLMYVLCRALDEYADIPYKRITICTNTGGFLGEFSGIGTEDGKIMWPVAGVVDNDDKLYVSDEALNRISIFDQDGKFVTKWGKNGDREGEFNGPSGIAFDRDGHLLVVDSLNNRIQRYTSDGQFVGQWGQAGKGDGEFDMPWGIAVDNGGDVYVADWRNDRIQRFDSSGKHLASWGDSGQGEGEFNRPSGVAVDDEGLVYVSDWGNERVQVLGADGRFRMELRGEATPSTWAEDYFESNPLEYETRKAANLEPDVTDPDDRFQPRSSLVEKLFWGPTSVKVDGEGRIYVVDSGRHRIQIYQKQS